VERVQTLADGTRVAQPSQKMKQYRDSAGRTRNEITMAPNMPGAQAITVISIADPANGFRYTLDPRTNTARKMAQASPEALAAARTAAQNKRPETSSEPLGTETIQGVLARGTRVTLVYPVGSSGNDRPITATNESWFAVDLRVMLQSKMSDPRFGDSTTTLTNISRAEPDPTLFQIPPDYQVIEGR
jgi:hypothetical protein